jgi:membrane-bound serine protease (ClpP class)
VVLGLILARIPADLFSSPAPDPAGSSYEMPSIGWGGAFAGAAVPVLAGLGLGAVGIAVLMRFFPRVPILNRLVLQADLAGAVVSAGQPAGVDEPGKLVGRLGTAVTNLRPGGSARFDGRLMDVISDSEWLEAGTQLKIVSADSNRIVVRRA